MPILREESDRRRVERILRSLDRLLEGEDRKSELFTVSPFHIPFLDQSLLPPPFFFITFYSQLDQSSQQKYIVPLIWALRDVSQRFRRHPSPTFLRLLSACLTHLSCCNPELLSFPEAREDYYPSTGENESAFQSQTEVSGLVFTRYSDASGSHFIVSSSTHHEFKYKRDALRFWRIAKGSGYRSLIVSLWLPVFPYALSWARPHLCISSIITSTFSCSVSKRDFKFLWFWHLSFVSFANCSLGGGVGSWRKVVVCWMVEQSYSYATRNYFRRYVWYLVNCSNLPSPLAPHSLLSNAKGNIFSLVALRLREYRLPSPSSFSHSSSVNYFCIHPRLFQWEPLSITFFISTPVITQRYRTSYSHSLVWLLLGSISDCSFSILCEKLHLCFRKRIPSILVYQLPSCSGCLLRISSHPLLSLLIVLILTGPSFSCSPVPRICSLFTFQFLSHPFIHLLFHPPFLFR